MKLPADWKLMQREFFEAPPEIVAPQLLGAILASRTDAGWVAGRIVEVEAYYGPHSQIPDPAAHSFRGVTPRNEVMFGPPGHAYVYFIYGVHYCVNVTCEPAGMAGCILIRALEPVLNREAMTAYRKLRSNNTQDANLTGGPGRLCQALQITRPTHNGLDLVSAGSSLQLLSDGSERQPYEISTRIGIRHAADLPLRFSVANHACVSRNPKSRPKRAV